MRDKVERSRTLETLTICKNKRNGNIIFPSAKKIYKKILDMIKTIIPIYTIIKNVIKISFIVAYIFGKKST